MQNVIMAAKGNIPVILTIPHDGKVVGFNGEDLPIKRPERQNDGTDYLVYQILKDIEERFKKKPFALFQKVERKRLTRKIILSFYNHILENVEYCLGRWGKCYLFDIHGFENQPKIGNYDIVLGTNHRKTILDNSDLRFGRTLSSWVLDGKQYKLRVYVPDVEPKEGEKYGATKDFTLVKWIKDRESRVNAIQIEIYKNWLMSDCNTEMLMRILSNTLAFYAV